MLVSKDFAIAYASTIFGDAIIEACEMPAKYLVDGDFHFENSSYRNVYLGHFYGHLFEHITFETYRFSPEEDANEVGMMYKPTTTPTTDSTSYEVLLPSLACFKNIWCGGQDAEAAQIQGVHFIGWRLRPKN